MEGGAGQRRDRGARARDVLSAGKRYTLLARIAARGDLGPRRSGLPRGVIFPAADEKRAPRKTRATARARGRKPSTAGDRDAGIASVPAVPVPRGHDGFVPSGFPAPACLEWEARPPARGETRGSRLSRRGMARFPRRRTLVGRPLMTMNPPLRTEPACMGTVVDAPASAVSNSSTSEWSDMVGCSACLGVCLALQEKGFTESVCGYRSSHGRKIQRLSSVWFDSQVKFLRYLPRWQTIPTSSARFPSARLFLPRSIRRVGCSRPRERGGLPMRRTLAAALAGVGRRVVPRSCLSGASPSCAARSTAWHAHASAVPSSGHFAHASAAASGSEPFAGRPRSDAGSKPGGSTDRASGAGAMRGFVAINKRIIQCVDGTNASAPPANRFGRDVFPKRATNRFFGRRVRSDERFARPSWTFVSP